MLHLRLRVPADLVEEVLADLEQDDTVTNVAVIPGGFHKPEGTLVLADVTRESATSVIGRLRTLKVQHRGSISIEQPDTVLSDDATRAEAEAPGSPDDGVVWESVEQRLRDGSRLSWVFIAFMTIAALIAGVGRITDQPILIVGAMVVGPEFTPIAALCFAIARPRPSMLPLAARALAVGFACATLIATVFWSALFRLGAFTEEQATGGQITHFIVSPDAWSFAVAVFAGVAGVLSLTTAKSEVLVGVFISVTTIPALGTVAVCLACGAWDDVASAAGQLGLNLVGIIVAGTTTLLLQRLLWQHIQPSRLHLGR